MRIIAGDRKGATLYAPRGMNTRPTSGKVRESLFNQLAHGGLETGFEGLRVLDLFAGSGALGLEALSRGAASAVMVDGEVAALELRALGVLFSIFKRLAPFLAMNPSALPRIYVPWTGEKRTKAQCDVICRLTPDLDADEIALRTRACGTFLRS